MDLLDQCYFVLPEEAFDRFNVIVDNPPSSNLGLDRLLKGSSGFDNHPSNGMLRFGNGGTGSLW